jgi:hypothetical protein
VQRLQRVEFSKCGITWLQSTSRITKLFLPRLPKYSIHLLIYKFLDAPDVIRQVVHRGVAGVPWVSDPDGKHHGGNPSGIACESWERYGTGVDLPLRRRHSKGDLKPVEVHCNEWSRQGFLVSSGLS